MALDSLPQGAGRKEQEEARSGMSPVGEWTSAGWEGRLHLTPVKDISDRTLSFCARFRLCMALALGGLRQDSGCLAGCKELDRSKFCNDSYQ